MKIKVLNNGFISLVDRMGNDYSVIRSARVSTGSDVVKGAVKDRGLIRYLYRNNHMTPFEQVVLTFHMRSPLFVNQQLLRHRSMSFNQESARYKEFKWSTYFPEGWRAQDTKNKQGSLDELDFTDTSKALDYGLAATYNAAKTFYEDAIADGVAREEARIVMPMGQYTEIFFTVDLRNLLHFLELRTHPHAQQEIREYAQAIHDILMAQDDLAWTMGIFNEMTAAKFKFAELTEIYKNDINELIDNLDKVKSMITTKEEK